MYTLHNINSFEILVVLLLKAIFNDNLLQC